MQTRCNDLVKTIQSLSYEDIIKAQQIMQSALPLVGINPLFAESEIYADEIIILLPSRLQQVLHQLEAFNQKVIESLSWGYVNKGKNPSNLGLDDILQHICDLVPDHPELLLTVTHKLQMLLETFDYQPCNLHESLAVKIIFPLKNISSAFATRAQELLLPSKDREELVKQCEARMQSTAETMHVHAQLREACRKYKLELEKLIYQDIKNKNHEISRFLQLSIPTYKIEQKTKKVFFYYESAIQIAAKHMVELQKENKIPLNIDKKIMTALLQYEAVVTLNNTLWDHPRSDKSVQINNFKNLLKEKKDNLLLINHTPWQSFIHKLIKILSCGLININRWEKKSTFVREVTAMGFFEKPKKTNKEKRHEDIPMRSFSESSFSR